MPVSYANDVRPLFRQIDIEHMAFFCDLANYDDVKTNANDILGRLKATDETVMPPKTSGGPWPAENIKLFENWIAQGCLP